MNSEINFSKKSDALKNYLSSAKELSEDERKASDKRRLEDEIKNDVVLLFIKYFPDNRTEERLEKFKKTGRWCNYNEAAITFAQNGGWKDLERHLNNWDLSKSIEEDTIPILDLLSMLKTNDSLVIKNKSGKLKNIILNKGSKQLLERMIIDWLEPRINLISFSSTNNESFKVDDIEFGNNHIVEHLWDQDMSIIKEKLKEWHGNKVSYKVGKEMDYYYSHWDNIIPWSPDQMKNTTERMIFLYCLAIAFKMIPNEIIPDLENGYDRQDLSKKIQYQIERQRKWEKTLEKRTGNFPD